MTTLNVEHMRAAYIRGTGPADSIVVGDVPVPRPGPGSVLVHNSVMAVNHVDTYIRSGAYATPLPGGTPFIVGRDLAGTVVELGSGVTGFAIGDSVWCNSLGHDGRQGSFSDYSVVPAERLYRMPTGVTPETMMTAAHTGATAYLGLVREARVRIGETVFIGGAAGGVGSAAVQLARAAGTRVLASCSPHDAEWVRSLGADEVFDRTDSALFERVYAASPGGIDVWWDTTGRFGLAQAFPLLGRGARVVVTAKRQGTKALELPTDFYTRDVQLRGFAISNASIGDLAEAAAALGGLLTRGGFKSRVAKVLSLEEAAGAHRLMESHAAPGKLLVKPGAARPKPHAPGAAAGAAGAAGAAPGLASAAAKPHPPTSQGAAAGGVSGAATRPAPAASASPKPGPKPTKHTSESGPLPDAPASRQPSAPKPSAPKPTVSKPAGPKPSPEPKK